MQRLRSSADQAPVDWLVSDGPVGYEAAVAAMQARAEAISAGHAPELVWLSGILFLLVLMASLRFSKKIA